MGSYRHLRVDELPEVPSPTDHKREIDEAVGATEFGFNLYEADPGQRLPWGYHYHPDHEEIFYVLEGQVAFETPEGAVNVEADEVFFVPRGHPQRGHVVGDNTARVIAVGAPKSTDGSIIQEECPECGETTEREYDVSTEDGREAYVLTCAECESVTDVLTAGPS